MRLRMKLIRKQIKVTNKNVMDAEGRRRGGELAKKYLLAGYVYGRPGGGLSVCEASSWATF